MLMFIWKRVAGLTSRYHASGGLMVVADSLAHARQFMKLEREAALEQAAADDKERWHLLKAELEAEEKALAPDGKLDPWDLEKLAEMRSQGYIAPAVETLETEPGPG